MRMQHSRRARARHRGGRSWGTPRRCQLLISDGVGIGVIRDLVIILAQRSDQPKLVLGIGIEDERTESSVAVIRIVKNLRHRRLQAEIASISVHADVVSKALAVSAAIDLVVGLVEIAEAEDQVAFACRAQSRCAGRY